VLRYALLPLLFCLAAALPAGGSRENKVQVTGKVRLVGSEPFPELVISGSDGEFYIDREDVSKLRDLQQRTVVVEGTLTVRSYNYANGRPAGERRTLKDIKIIKVE